MSRKVINSLAHLNDDDISALIMRKWGVVWGGTNQLRHVVIIYPEGDKDVGAPEAPHHLKIGDFINQKRREGAGEPTARALAWERFGSELNLTESAIAKIYKEYYQRKQESLLRIAVINGDMAGAIRCVRNMLDGTLRSLGLLDP